jgi:hypothetical protein
VLAAVVTPLTVSRVTARPAPSAPAPANLTARGVLLTAATAAAAVPGTGGYWRVTSVDGYLAGDGPNSRPYAVEYRLNPTTSWYPVSPDKQAVRYTSLSFVTGLPTTGAAVAWRADGSPPLPRRTDQEPQADNGAAAWYFGGPKLTAAQYRALPASTSGLKDAIIKAIQPTRSSANLAPRDEQVMVVCIALLQSDPVTPAVRAAAFRVLATVPGIQLSGKTKDPFGRAGYGITLPTFPGWSSVDYYAIDNPPSGDTPAQTRLVISLAGTLLAREVVATAATKAVSVLPASGAVPGPTQCPSATHYVYQPKTSNSMGRPRHALCIPKGDHVDSDQVGAISIDAKAAGTPFYLDQPALAVPAGTVLSYLAYAAAGWTNDTPSAAGSAHGIPGQ